MPEISDLNLATYIKVVKKIPTAGHRFTGNQLWVNFEVTEDQIASFQEEYLNSSFADYDSTKRNFMHLLRRGK